jgi:GT2 family glycosyltransferase
MSVRTGIDSGISIVIPTWNGVALLDRFLPSVIAAAEGHAKQESCQVEIIVVDDGSADGSVEWLHARGFKESCFGDENPCLRLLVNHENLGFGRACNRAIEAAGFGLVLLLNNDVEIEADCIGSLAENFRDASVFAAHCRVIDARTGKECGTGKLGGFARGFIRVHRSYIAVDRGQGEHRETPLYSMFAGGGASMFDRSKFIAMGGFDEIYSPFYWEDVELSYRGWKRGYSVVYEPRAVAHHKISSTIGGLNPGRVRRIQQRNRLLYHWVHLHDSGLMLSHVAWVVLLALTAPIRLQPGFLLSLTSAIASMPTVLKRRREERDAANRTDREVFSIFRAIEKAPGIVAYDRHEELLQDAIRIVQN